ncbi:MAG: helix-turn-helix domain-containing protein [Muribaculaceae bacterium]|nr:helix-turn-helix domain-containing protein [Muribaculaceae bacterium]
MNDKIFKKLIGERVKYYRKQKNLTQEQLAEIMDFNTKSISLLENGHNYIALNKVPKLCTTLSIEPYQLFIFDKRSVRTENVQNDIHELLNTMDKNKLKLAYRLLYELNEFELQA